MADMADITLSVGAEVDTRTAEVDVESTFRSMAQSLDAVGTEEAKSLAERIRAILAAMSKGVVDASEMKALAEVFAAVNKSAGLSNRQIREMSGSIDDAVDNSRHLADALGDGAEDNERIGMASEKIEDALDALVPGTKSVTSEISQWARKLPGVDALIKKLGVSMKSAAAAAAVVFAVVGMTGARKKELRDLEHHLREREESKAEEEQGRVTGRKERALERRRKYGADLTQNRAGTVYRVENDKGTVREIENDFHGEEVLRHRQAMLDVDKRIRDIERESAKIAFEKVAHYEEQIEHYERAYDAAQRLADLEKEESDMEVRERTLEDEMAVLRERRKIAEYEEKSVSERMEKLQRYRSEAEKSLTETRKRIEEQVKSGEMSETDAADYIKEMLSDTVKNVTAMTGFELSATDAQSMFESFDDAIRSLAIRMEEIADEKSDIQYGERAKAATRTEIERDKEEIAAKRARNTELDEKTVSDLKRTERDRVEERRQDIAGTSNRLTQLGLGGGNLGADSAAETARNTKDMVTLMREQLRRRIVDDGTALRGGGDGKKMDTTINYFSGGAWGM